MSPCGLAPAGSGDHGHLSTWLYPKGDRVVIVLITHPFICLFICVTHFLATYYLPDSVLGIGHGTVKKIDKVLFFRECLFLKRDIDNNK